MITKIKIENFILTDKLTVEFNEGLNVLSGETGAGKSIIVGALDYIFGKQVRADLFYKKSEPVFLEALFNLNNSQNKITQIEDILGTGIILDSSNIRITKEITIKGKPQSFLNDIRINQKQIIQIRKLMIDFHSQRDQLQLFDNQYQLEILDSWLGLGSDKSDYKRTYYELRNLFEKRNILIAEDKKQSDKIRLYEYQIEELEQLDLTKDEEERVNEELNLLTHSEELLLLCSEMQQSFIEQDNSIIDIISSYHQRFERIGSDNKSIESIISSLSNISQLVNDLQSDARALQDSIYLDESRLSNLEERQNEIIRIKNKHKMDLPSILDFLEEMKMVVNDQETRETEIEQLKERIEDKIKIIQQRTKQLSSKRKIGATRLSTEIMKNFNDLSIPNGIFSVDVESIGNILIDNGIKGGLSETGNDKVEFLFSANKGITPQSLNNVVSGGELSRLLLIVKKILASEFDNPTLILDEIDTGIGGKTANNMGKYISKLAEKHQVICITHLPQIASFA